MGSLSCWSVFGGGLSRDLQYVFCYHLILSFRYIVCKIFIIGFSDYMRHHDFWTWDCNSYFASGDFGNPAQSGNSHRDSGRIYISANVCVCVYMCFPALNLLSRALELINLYTSFSYLCPENQIRYFCWGANTTVLL